jgi:hypothetical protein
MTQTTLRISPERAQQLIAEIADAVRGEEVDDADPIVVTAIMHPLRTGETD